MFGDLKSLLGYATHASLTNDPIDPNAWWQQMKQEEASDERESESGDETPRPPGEQHNAILTEVVEKHRGANGRIKWRNAHEEFLQETGWVCLQNQLKDRFHTLKRNGRY